MWSWYMILPYVCNYVLLCYACLHADVATGMVLTLVVPCVDVLCGVAAKRMNTPFGGLLDPITNVILTSLVWYNAGICVSWELDILWIASVIRHVWLKVNVGTSFVDIISQSNGLFACIIYALYSYGDSNQSVNMIILVYALNMIRPLMMSMSELWCRISVTLFGVFILTNYTVKDPRCAILCQLLVVCMAMLEAVQLNSQCAVVFVVAYATGVVLLAPVVVLKSCIECGVSDICQYVCGRALSPFYKSRPFPHISPNKTVVGYVGGLLLTPLIMMYTIGSDPVDVAVHVILASMGGLCMSKIKRNAHMKDSGTTLFLMGGILDRLDSIAPVMTCVIIASYA